MTQEEAIVNLEKLIALFYTASEQSKMVDYSKIIETLEFAAAALRPISREQVEKVWRGEWRLNEEESKKHVEPIYVCTRCENFEAWGNTEKTNFCGYCGAPMTDEAVEIVVEKINNMEEMTNEH